MWRVLAQIFTNITGSENQILVQTLFSMMLLMQVISKHFIYWQEPNDFKRTKSDRLIPIIAILFRSRFLAHTFVSNNIVAWNKYF